MMSADHNLEVDFKLVRYKRRAVAKSIKRPVLSGSPCAEDFDKETAVRRINEGKEDISSSDLYSSVIASLREGLSSLGDPKIKTIVCLGLGKIGECMTSRYQLALVLCLKDLFDARVHVYDPVFAKNERSVLSVLDCDVLSENLEGKYRVMDNDATIFYLPHCPKQLSNNLLWANWGLQLSNCIIIANSFARILEAHTRRVLNESAGYLLCISPYAVELAVINTFKYFDIFNDTAIHVFPPVKLSLIPCDFWNDQNEPEYSVEDVESFESMTASPNVHVLRQIISELRRSNPGTSLKDNLTARYVLNQFRKYQTTDRQLCKAQEEVKFMANTYLCYLRSNRLHQKISQEFHGRGERSVADTAKMVGFKLPHDPK